MADSGKEDIKGKGLMYPEGSGTGEEVKAEEDKQCTSSQALDIDGKEPITPNNINSEDLSVLHMFAQREGLEQNMPQLLKQQQDAYRYFQQINTNRPNQSNAGDPLGGIPMFETRSNMLRRSGSSSYEELLKQLEESANPFPGQVQNPRNPRGESSSSMSLGLGQAQEQDPTQLYDPNDSDLGIDYAYDEDYFNPTEELLMELEVPHSNRLLIPYYLAFAIFPPLSSYPKEETLELVGQRGREWSMSLTFDRNEQAFIINRGFQEYLKYYLLRPKDMILIYKPVPQMHENHFTIEHEVKPRLDLRPRFPDPPEFREDNFLFEIELGTWEVAFGRLLIRGELVRNHFDSAIVATNEERVKLMKFTDGTGKDWYLYLEYPNVTDVYMIVDGWMEYVDEKELCDKDVVRFYKHVTPASPRHFLIRDVRKKIKKDDKKPSITLGKRTTFLREKEPSTSGKRPLLLQDAVFRAPRPRK